MNRTDLRDAVVAALQSVAPEADAAALADDRPFRDALDIDSMDFLNFVIALHKSLRVDIPEADYSKVQTLAGAVTYLDNKLGAATAPARTGAGPA